MGGGQRLVEEPHRKDMSGLFSRGCEGADGRLSRIRNTEQPGEDVNAGSVLARRGLVWWNVDQHVEMDIFRITIKFEAALFIFL